jgi:CheY-like chemotaxis protein
MPSLSRVIVADADAKAAQTLALGFGRDGVVVEKASRSADVGERLLRHGAELVVAAVDLEGDEDGIALVKRLRRHGSPGTKVPIILVGAEEQRASAVAAGVTDFVAKPAYVRDVVTLGQLLAGPKGIGGELGELHLFYVLRALASAQRTGTLVLVRNSRRGELRFWEGEVTSAQTGTLHGLAALHQLLLWTDARFELREEDVVRRQQIPLSREELFADAERFLRDFQELAGDLYPATIYEQVVAVVAALGDEIPKEISPVVRLFDGHRTFADVIEDSPFRVVETVRVARKLYELEAIRRSAAARVKGGKALVIEDWLVGGTPPAGVTIPTAAIAAADDAARHHDKQEWGPIPQPAPWSSAHFAPIVPSLSQSGEVLIGDVAASIEVAAVAKVSAEVEAEVVGAETPSANGNGKDMAQSQPKRATTKRDSVGGVVAATKTAAVGDAFDALDEAFFAQESKYEEPPAPVDTFDDLGAAKPAPKGFWARLFAAK